VLLVLGFVFGMVEVVAPVRFEKPTNILKQKACLQRVTNKRVTNKKVTNKSNTLFQNIGDSGVVIDEV
tara:strand:- start:1107 stop:1310 length:204 start_codon:yes stop_codon:yes gene_type:complete